MTCRYEKEDRLKDKKMEKISKMKIFSIRLKSNTTTIKRESGQTERHITLTPSGRVNFISLFISPPS